MKVNRVPRLHLIGPLGPVCEPLRYAAVALEAVRGGVDAVHVRMPGVPGGDVYDLTRSIQAQIAGSGATLVVNDRVDVAALLNTGGLHLGERSLRVSDARMLLPFGVLIGRSVHDVDGAVQAEADGADYVIAGHVFDTDSKPGVPGRGIEWLAEVSRAVEIPVIAIGGITVEQIPQVVASGASGVAVGRELLEAADPVDTAARMNVAMDVERA